MQALKAGVMEIPDVIAINKADHPLAQTTLREVRGVLALAPPGSAQIPALLTDALSGEGIAELDAALEAQRASLHDDGALAARRRRNLRNEVVAQATARWRRELEERLDGDARFEALLDEVVGRRLDPLSAAESDQRAGATAHEPQPRPGRVDRAYLVVDETGRETGFSHRAVIEIGLDARAALGPGEPQPAALSERASAAGRRRSSCARDAGEQHDDLEGPGQAGPHDRVGEPVGEAGGRAEDGDAGARSDAELAREGGAGIAGGRRRS